MPTHYTGTPKEKRALEAFIKLTRAADSTARHVNAHLREHDLTESQFGALEALFHLGPLQSGELGEKILKSSANMTMVLDNLVRRELVTRRRRESDRRCVDIHLTETGRALVARILPHHVEGVVEAFSALKAAEQKELAALCRKLGLSLTESRP